jgi:hypothetical protein
MAVLLAMVLAAQIHSKFKFNRKSNVKITHNG